MSKHKNSGCDCRLAEVVKSHDKKCIDTLCKIYDAACGRRFEANTAEEIYARIKMILLKMCVNKGCWEERALGMPQEVS